MSYFQGQSTIPVKPVTRRDTLARGQTPQRARVYLQQPGRGPLNRRAYPTAGRPVASAGNGKTLGTPLNFSLALEPGGQLGGLFDIPTLTTSFTPTISTTTAAPAKEEVGFLSNLVTGALNIWNSRPQVLKDISFKVDPNVAMATAQRLVSSGQMTQAVDYLRSVGINPSYLGVPITGSTAGAAWTVAGIDFKSYLPWIIGGGAILLILPMVMSRK